MANNKKRKPRKVNSVKPANTANTKTENVNSTVERQAYGYSSSTSNKSMVLRIIILVVAGLNSAAKIPPLLQPDDTH